MGTKILYLDSEGNKAMDTAISVHIGKRNKMSVAEVRTADGKILVFSTASADIRVLPELLANSTAADLTQTNMFVDSYEDSLQGRARSVVSDILDWY